MRKIHQIVQNISEGHRPRGHSCGFLVLVLKLQWIYAKKRESCEHIPSDWKYLWNKKTNNPARHPWIHRNQVSFNLPPLVFWNSSVDKMFNPGTEESWHLLYLAGIHKIRWSPEICLVLAVSEALERYNSCYIPWMWLSQTHPIYSLWINWR